MKKYLEIIFVSLILIFALCSCRVENDNESDLIGQTWSFGPRDSDSVNITEDMIKFNAESIFYSIESPGGLFYPNCFNTGIWTDSDGRSYRLFFDNYNLVCVIPID